MEMTPAAADFYTLYALTYTCRGLNPRKVDQLSLA